MYELYVHNVLGNAYHDFRLMVCMMKLSHQIPTYCHTYHSLLAAISR